MAKNQSRSMNAELQQGAIDGRYMQLAPGWSLEENPPPLDRLDWPGYEQVEDHRTPGTFRTVPTVDNTIVQRARHRHQAETSALPSRRFTSVDRGAYHGNL